MSNKENTKAVVCFKRKNCIVRVNYQLPMSLMELYFLIDQDVLHTITQTFGDVLRIVIFKKHGVQAMVEYPFPKMIA